MELDWNPQQIVPTALVTWPKDLRNQPSCHSSTPGANDRSHRVTVAKVGSTRYNTNKI